MSQCTCTKDSQITCIVHPTDKALKARIAKLEAELSALASPERERLVLDAADRIKELEAVAEAAVIVCQLVDEKSSMVYGLLERPLRAAGYLK